MPKEVNVNSARWKNFRMKPVKVYVLTGVYGNVRHVFSQESSDIYRISQQLAYCHTISTAHILSNKFTYLNSLTL